MPSPRRLYPFAIILLTVVDLLALQLDEFLAWLNPKGVRELALKNSFIKWWSHIAPGMRKRISDLNISAKLPEARRSTRTKSSGHDVSREPYMMWTNRRAVNSV